MIVVDANVALKLYVEEAGSDQAFAVFSTNTGQIFAPDIFVTEVAGALVRLANMRHTPPLIIAEGLRNFADLIESEACHLVRLSSRDMLTAADVAIDIGHPFRDCLYLVLADQFGCPFITFDAKFAEKARAYHPHIQLLAS